jgi:hypothetical protein
LNFFWDQGFLTFVGIIVTIIVALVIYLLQKQKKILSFKIFTNTSLLSVQEEIKKDIEILYKGNPVKQVQLIILKIVSLGNIPIRCDDYDTPITIYLGEKSQILSAEILGKKPDDLKISIKVEGNKIVIQKCLLNQDDMVAVRILATNVCKKLKVQGRIAGVQKISEITEDSRLKSILVWSSIISMFGGLILGVTGQMLNIVPPGFPSITLIGLIIGGALVTIVWLWDQRDAKRNKKELEMLKIKTPIEN